MIDQTLVELSRLQFAATAMYHFLFVPLTLGLSFMLVIMESVFVMTGRTVWRDMTKFWGTLFGINFAMGVATGIVMEFQFGMNWSYYSHYVGDIFGAPLAIEGLMAFFLEATFVGLFFFGWERLSRVKHLMVTFLVAIGSNLSALWILVANGWMQHPVGSAFNVDTMRMEITDFGAVLTNPVAQAKFVHTVSAGYVTGAIFVLSISAWFLLRGQHRALARRSFAVAAAFGLASSLSVVVLGDESGYTLTENQKMKLAAIEAMWETEEAPAAFTLFGFPDQDARETHAEIKLPYVMGLIATRSLDGEVEGINDIVADGAYRIKSGVVARRALRELQLNPADKVAQLAFETYEENLGHAMLLDAVAVDPLNPTDREIQAAADSLVPTIAPLFWSFRLMVALGMFFIAATAYAFWLSTTHQVEDKRWFLWVLAYSWPLPWVACELGWFVAEFGRQPWIIEGVLPTANAVSGLAVWEVGLTLAGFTALYAVLIFIEVRLMLKVLRQGPEPTHPAPRATALSGMAQLTGK